jgi:protein-tyrosine-phosphatase
VPRGLSEPATSEPVLPPLEAALPNAFPKAVSDKAAQMILAVIEPRAFESGPAEFTLLARRRLDWQIPDAKEMSPEQFRAVRDLIEAKVKELLQTL